METKFSEVRMSDNYEEICTRMDKKLGKGIVFAGVLAEVIAEENLKGELKKDIIECYAKNYGISQRELKKMIKARE